MLSSHLLLVAAGLFSPSLGALQERWYNITRVMANPDGQFERSVIGVNGTWPPPILEVNASDTVRIHVHNGLDVPTAIHHHGIYFNGSSYFDGAPGITQCGIPPGQSLTYDVPVDLQNGTYWWHSHVGSQYVDGLRAPFLIHPETEVHAYDDEYTVVLGDWYHQQHSTLLSKFLNIFNPTGAEPVPNSALIYFTHKGQYLPGFNENATIAFTPGKTYRLRIINTGAFAMFNFWIDGHSMRVIEVEGTDVEEYPIETLSIAVAQRYSVLVTALNTTDQNFAIRANFEDSMFDTVPPALVLNYTSTIVYAPNVPTATLEIKDEFEMTMEEAFVPTTVEAQLNATKFIELGVLFATFDDGVNRAAFNNITFQMPKVPSLFSELSMGANASNVDVYGPQTHAYILEKDDIVDLQIINWDLNSHPFHLHGHKFQVVRVAMDVSTNDTALNPPHIENQPNPMRRDTISVPGGGAVNIRFVADNPGAWIFHCHIEWHIQSGLAMVFIEAPVQAQLTLKPPTVMYDQCTALDIPFTGNAVGRNSTTDLAGVIRGPYPQVLNWLPKGIGAMAGSILCALLGMLTVTWYAFGGQLDVEEVEEQVKEKIAAKRLRGGKIFRIKKAFARKNVVTAE